MSKRFPAYSWVEEGEDLVYTLPEHIDSIESVDANEDNTTRAQYAALAVRTFADRVCPGGEELETLMGDLLANLMHLADAAGISFENCLDRGRMHYDAEIHGEP